MYDIPPVESKMTTFRGKRFRILSHTMYLHATDSDTLYAALLPLTGRLGYVSHRVPWNMALLLIVEA